MNIYFFSIDTYVISHYFFDEAYATYLFSTINFFNNIFLLE